MVVGFGRKPKAGSLPVFSVADPEEASELLTLACETNLRGEFIAKELVMEQSLENLERFSDRLQLMHDKYLVPRGRCRCSDTAPEKSAS